MKPEHHHLLDDAFTPAVRRDAILTASSHVLRRRRHKRIAGQLLAIALVAVTAFAVLEQRPAATVSAPMATNTSHSATAASPAVQTLTDDELLALFPKTPVGLVKLSNGHKVLIFPQPGDEKRFITHL